MCSRIDDHIFHIMKNIFRIFSRCINRKHKYLHSFKMIMFFELQHFWSEISQIFCHKIYFRYLFQKCVNHFISRCPNPFSFNCSRTSSRNLPESVKRTKMIDSDNVKQSATVSDSIHPKLISILFEIIPVINWISPSLPCRTEIIRRHTCNESRSSVCI